MEDSTGAYKKSEFAEREEQILAMWLEKRVFEQSLEATRDKEPFVYYDGPPFATGLPHFGHLLPTSLKDAVPRYQTMRGRYVTRQWGWDCHGLPIENLIQKELDLPTKKDIEAYGVERFSEAAKASVMRFDAEWKKVIPRAGRWVDMENAYMTLNPDFTESGWWAFKTLHGKGLVYEGFRSMHVSPLLETPLSNMEVSQNYKEITDLSAFVSFELADEPGTHLIAWTTTPWTLPGNVALAVNPDFEYSKLRIQKKVGEEIVPMIVVVAKSRLEALAKVVGEYEVLGEMKGSDLAGKAYVPLYDYYAKNADLANRENGWKVYAASFVTDDSGTGIVHIAPGFGQDDLELAKANALPFVQHVGINGVIKDEVPEFAGHQAKPKEDPMATDVLVIKDLAHRGRLFAKEKIVHSYPHCWRTEAPLINYAMSSWFIKVGDYRPRMVELNNGVDWTPQEVGAKRFGDWLKAGPDWSVSRSRYWGAPLPIWKSEDGSKVEVLGSFAELKDKTRGDSRVFLMRHAESKGNVADVVSSKPGTDDGLTDYGVQQACSAAVKLKDSGITVIYTSDMTRAKETAEVVRSVLGLPTEAVVVDERLREFAAGEFDGKSWDAFHGYIDEVPMSERYKRTVPGGESYSAVKRRAMDFIFDIDARHRATPTGILVVSHGAPISLMHIGSAPTQEDRVFAAHCSRAHLYGNAEVRQLDFAPFPHDRDFTLDMHRPYIDKIEWKAEDGSVMRRIPDVFDTWYDSGSVPFAKFHYPFENKEEFDRGVAGEPSTLFPADFIAEAVDQTRGWFYSLLALNTPLFDRAPYKSVIVNGLVLAEDGQKMSKSKGNFPPVMETIGEYSADALRYFLLSSQAMRAEDVALSIRSVDEVQKKLIGRLRNVVTFFETYAADAPALVSLDVAPASSNVLDAWIVSRLAELRAEITEAMDTYRIDRAVRPFMNFVDDLSTWYLRRSRDRFKSEDVADRTAAMAVTRFTLIETSRLLAPFMPFLAEDVYQRAAAASLKKDSVHLESWPSERVVDASVLATMAAARSAVSLGLEQRARANAKVRQPLASVTLNSATFAALRDAAYGDIVLEELNIKALSFSDSIEGVAIDTTITDELRAEGVYRDVLRALQSVRKNMSLVPGQPVAIAIATNADTRAALEHFASELRAAASCTDLSFVDSLEDGVTLDGVDGVTARVTPTDR